MGRRLWFCLARGSQIAGRVNALRAGGGARAMIGLTSLPARSRAVRRLAAATAALTGAWVGLGAPSGADRPFTPIGRAMAPRGAPSPRPPPGLRHRSRGSRTPGGRCRTESAPSRVSSCYRSRPWSVSGDWPEPVNDGCATVSKPSDATSSNVGARALGGAFAGEVEVIGRACAAHFDYALERVNFWIENSRRKKNEP